MILFEYPWNSICFSITFHLWLQNVKILLAVGEFDKMIFSCWANPTNVMFIGALFWFRDKTWAVKSFLETVRFQFIFISSFESVISTLFHLKNYLWENNIRRPSGKKKCLLSTLLSDKEIDISEGEEQRCLKNEVKLSRNTLHFFSSWHQKTEIIDLKQIWDCPARY